MLLMMELHIHSLTLSVCLLASLSPTAVDAQTLEDFIEDADVRELTLQYRTYCPHVPLCNKDVMDVINVTDVSQPCCLRCSCGPTCLEFGDCCPDILPEVPAVPEYPPLEQCTRLAYLDDDLSTFQYFRVIAECRRNYPNREVASMCARDYSNYNFTEGITGFMPVTDGATGLTYKNLHCLRCNGGNETATLYWDVEVACPLNSEIPIIFLQNSPFFVHSGCNVLFESPTVDHSKDTFVHPRICMDVIRECNVTGDVVEVDQQTEKFCHAYTSVYKNFRNVHCALCNGVSSADILNDNIGCESITAPPVTYRDKMDIEGLVAAEEWEKTNNLSTERSFNPAFQDCIEARELFMIPPYQGACVSRHCQKPQYLHGDTCRPVYSRASSYPVHLSMRLYPLQPTRLRDTNVQTFQFIVEYVLDEFAKRPDVKNSVTNITYDLLVKIDERFDSNGPFGGMSEGGETKEGGEKVDGGERWTNRPEGGERRGEPRGEGEEWIDDIPNDTTDEERRGAKVLYLELKIRVFSNNVDDATAFVETCYGLYNEFNNLAKFQLEYIGNTGDLLSYVLADFASMSIDLPPELQKKYGVQQAITDRDWKFILVFSEQYDALSLVDIYLVSPLTFCSQVVLNASRFQRDVTGNGSVEVHVNGRKVSLSMVVFDDEYHFMLMCENVYEDLFASNEISGASSRNFGFSRIDILALVWITILKL